MKKTIIYIVLIAALAALAWYLVKENKYKSSLKAIQDEYAFAVEDTNAITKIIIQDKTPSKATLTRTENGWTINKKYPARTDAINVLLETLNRMSMRNFVAIPAEENIVKRLAVYGKEVKVYQGEKLVKHFFVGTETPDQTGTYMMLKGASKPFSVHIQGFVGYLNSRFFTNEDLWRKRVLFNVSQKQVAEVKMEYPGEPERSFVIDNTQEKPILKTLDGTTVPEALEINLNITLGSFKTASYEGTILPTDGIWNKRDSLLNAPNAFVLTLATKDGKTFTMYGKHKEPDPNHSDTEAMVFEYDPSRLYAFLDDGRWVLIQYYGLRNIIVDREFYMNKILFND